MPESTCTAAFWPYRDSPAPDSVAGEKDACGVGFLAQLSGETSHWVLQQALRGLGCMEHRGGCGGDGDSGDGAGVLCEIPWSYLQAVWPEAAAAKGLGMLFMPQDGGKRDLARQFCEEEAAALGLSSAGWRVVPVDPSCWDLWHDRPHRSSSNGCWPVMPREMLLKRCCCD